jgi:hypothetical protein
MKGFVLLTAGLLAVACGETSSTSATINSPSAQSTAAPIVLSEVGDATPTVHLEAGSYQVAWQSPDPSFFVFCGLKSSADYGVTIGLSAEPANPKLVEDLVGGEYECQVKTKAGSAWKITFTRAP